MTTLKDLSVVAPEREILRIGSGDCVEEVDMTILPAYASLKIGEFITSHPKVWELPITDTIPLMTDVLGRLNKEITEEFLWERCNENQIVGIFQYLIERQLRERLKGAPNQEGEEKNGERR